MPLQTVLALPWAHRVVLVLLALQCIGICGVFPYYAWTEWPTPGLKIFATGLALIALGTLYGIWTRAAWWPWAALFVISAKLTIDLFAWSTGLDTTGTPFSAAILIAIAVLVLWIGEPATLQVTRAQKTFYGLIVFFPAWVALGGFFLAGRIEDFLPFQVPPLHARFIASMYLAGVILTVLSARAAIWRDVRVSTAMIGLWTGMLQVVSVLYVPAFDWTATPTWFWWIAYFWFPLGALFISLNQRDVQDPPATQPLHPALPPVLTAIGATAVVLSLLLLILPTVMMAAWPWKIPVMLAQIYGGPFMAYGLGALYAGRQSDWTAVRVPVFAILGFSTAAVIVSLLHAGLFSAAHIATWVWFLGLSGTAVTLALFVFIHESRARTAAAKGKP